MDEKYPGQEESSVWPPPPAPSPETPPAAPPKVMGPLAAVGWFIGVATGVWIVFMLVISVFAPSPWWADDPSEFSLVLQYGLPVATGLLVALRWRSSNMSRRQRTWRAAIGLAIIISPWAFYDSCTTDKTLEWDLSRCVDYAKYAALTLASLALCTVAVNGILGWERKEL